MIYFELRSNDMYIKKKEFGTLKFLDCGKIQVKHGWRHKDRFLECYELLFVETGTLHITVGGQPFDIYDSTLFLIPPYQRIKGHLASADETRFYWIDFATENAENLSMPESMAPIKFANNSKLLSFFNMMCECNIAESNQPNMLESLLMVILCYASGKENTSSGKSVVSQVLHYINNHLNQPLTTQSVARVLNYNKDYISRAIREATGLTLKEYINRRKMDTARILLRTSSFSIDEIAKQLGFDDGNLFTKFFTYHQHISPTEYRKSVM